MKLVSFAFQSLIKPDRMAMYSAVAPTIQEAYETGLKQLLEEQGDLAWRPLMQTAIDVQVEVPTTLSLSKLTDVEVSKENTNWLLHTIIKNKDTVLLNASKAYLTKPELLFIKDKIK